MNDASICDNGTVQRIHAQEKAMAHLRKLRENLGTFVNTLNRQRCSLRNIRGDILEDILDPLSSFAGPRYCCHERMRRTLSSFERVRFASESASPRSTIT